MADKTDKITWTDDERELLKFEMIKAFEAKKLPFEQWIVTVHTINLAQYTLLDETRWRKWIQQNTVDDLQARVKAYVAEDIMKMDAEFARLHREFLRIHGVSPYTQIEKLEQKIASLRLTANRAETLSTSSIAPASQTIAKGVDTWPVKAQTVSPIDEIPTELRLLLINPHMPQMARQLIDLKGVDVVWTDNKDDASKLRHKSDGRHVFLTSGVLGTHATRALKELSLSFHEIPGGNSRFSTEVAEFIAQHLAA